MAHYRFKAKISDDMVDAMEIIKNAGKSIAAGHADKNAILTNSWTNGLIAILLAFHRLKQWHQQCFHIVCDPF